MFNFIKDFTIKILEKLHITININRIDKSTTKNYIFQDNNTINVKKYYSFNKKRILLITSIISIIEIIYFFYLLNKPLIKVVPLNLLENLDAKFDLNFLRYILFIIFVIILFRFNKAILKNNFSKFELILHLISNLSLSILFFIFISNLFTLCFPLKI
ncbi:hypothetical protein [Clostridium baratii]|uniref:hypothetical protein n=1 Tax=Clostridium baratii TaxID=1561 RepID=UPI0030D3FC75